MYVSCTQYTPHHPLYNSTLLYTLRASRSLVCSRTLSASPTLFFFSNALKTSCFYPGKVVFPLATASLLPRTLKASHLTPFSPTKLLPCAQQRSARARGRICTSKCSLAALFSLQNTHSRSFNDQRPSFLPAPLCLRTMLKFLHRHLSFSAQPKPRVLAVALSVRQLIQQNRFRTHDFSFSQKRMIS